MLYRGYTARRCVTTINFLTFQVPKVTKINFLLMISIHGHEKKSWELINWPPRGKCCDLSTNSLHWFHKEKYGSHCGEFVWGYWGLKGQLSLTYRLHFDHHPFIWFCLTDLSEISRGEGSGNRGRVTTFWYCRKGRGHKKNRPLNGGGSCKYVSVIM